MNAWLFSRRIDLLTFGGSALLSLALIAVAYASGSIDADGEPAPAWVWISTVVLVDVAHVYGTAILVYLDPAEVKRRPVLYALVPIVGLALGWALASESEALFWRALAYVATFHFVRQQVGWVKLYRAKANDAGTWSRFVDEGTAYAVTIAPIVWWHSRLPTSIAWLAPGDYIAGLPHVIGDIALYLEVAFFVAYAARSLRNLTRGVASPGKDLVVFSTAILWGLGIVVWANDVVFTVTNVLAHGIPYAVLVVITAKRRMTRTLSVSFVVKGGVLAIVCSLWAFGFVEELLWDRLVYHDRAWLFPLPAIDVGAAHAFVIALLALPQLVHYVLDAFYWRRRDNPVL